MATDNGGRHRCGLGWAHCDGPRRAEAGPLISTRRGLGQREAESQVVIDADDADVFAVFVPAKDQRPPVEIHRHVVSLCVPSLRRSGSCRPRVPGGTGSEERGPDLLRRRAYCHVDLRQTAQPGGSTTRQREHANRSAMRSLSIWTSRTFESDAATAWSHRDPMF